MNNNNNDIQLNDDNTNNYTHKKNNNNNMIDPSTYYKDNFIDHGREGRKASNIYFLRKYNNYVKAILINKTAQKLGKNLSILDLCCGKGGDLDKFFQNSTKVYVGADMAVELLHNSSDRITKLKKEKYQNNKIFCMLLESDVSDPENNLNIQVPSFIKYDLVSCQMALHYHFKSEKTVRTFLDNVCDRLLPGGYFVATTISACKIVKKLRNADKDPSNIYKDVPFCFGNEFYSVKFETDKFRKDKPFGVKYGFFLEDSIDKKGEEGKINYVEEYLIILSEFLKICEEYGLELVEKKNFTDLYKDIVLDFIDKEESEIDSNDPFCNEKYVKLFTKFIRDIDDDNDNCKDLWDAIDLYEYLVFKKKDNSNTTGNYSPAYYSFKDKLNDSHFNNIQLITKSFN